jgi:hypothetical protein
MTTDAPISVQAATWYSAQLELAYQAASIIAPHIETIDVGNLKTYTGQYLQPVHSNLMGEYERAVFQTPQITTWTSSLSAYEAPVFVGVLHKTEIQFSPELMGRIVESIGMEMGRRTDKVIVNGINAAYDPEGAIVVDEYFDVQSFSEARNILGMRSARGQIINLLDFVMFNNLLLDERFSSWLFNYNRPLADSYPEPQSDNYFNYQGCAMLKLPNDTPLPKSTAGKVRSFMFTRPCCKLLRGTIPELAGIRSDFQIHRGGWDINTAMRLGFVLEQPMGVVAIESNAGFRPHRENS